MSWNSTVAYLYLLGRDKYVYAMTQHPLLTANSPAGGGFPGWLTNVAAKARTNQTGFTDAWTPYIEAVAKFAEPYQVCDDAHQENPTPTHLTILAVPGRSDYSRTV